MKLLNKTILEYKLSIFLFIIFIVGVGIFATLKIIQNNNHTYNYKDFIIDMDSKIDKKLEKLTDIEGIDIDANEVNITNNGIGRKYQIILTPIVENEDVIRVSINNQIIRYLSYFDKNEEGYIIYEKYLEKNYSDINKIRIWQNKISNLEPIKVDFEIKIKIIDN